MNYVATPQQKIHIGTSLEEGGCGAVRRLILLCCAQGSLFNYEQSRALVALIPYAMRTCTWSCQPYFQWGMRKLHSDAPVSSMVIYAEIWDAILGWLVAVATYSRQYRMRDVKGTGGRAICTRMTVSREHKTKRRNGFVAAIIRMATTSNKRSLNCVAAILAWRTRPRRVESKIWRRVWVGETSLPHNAASGSIRGPICVGPQPPVPSGRIPPSI